MGLAYLGFGLVAAIILALWAGSTWDKYKAARMAKRRAELLEAAADQMAAAESNDPDKPSK